FRSLRQKMDDSLRASDAHATSDAHGTLALLQNLSHRAGFVALEERVLVEQKNTARASADAEVFHGRLRALISFYANAGEYARAVELLEAESATDSARGQFAYASLLAEYSRLTGDGARELAALRSYYEAPRPESVAQTDPMVERYFNVLYDSGQQGREELGRRAQEPSQYSIQLVNFLIARGERELAHAAVASADLPAAWKLARSAQLSLALREFDARAEADFVAALRPASIGELLGAKHVKDAAGDQLAFDDWLRLETEDRKSTRLNSSHSQISYAVFCLKK